MALSPAQIAKGDQTLATLAEDYAWLVNQTQAKLADAPPIHRLAHLNHQFHCTLALPAEDLSVMLAYAIDRAAFDQDGETQ